MRYPFLISLIAILSLSSLGCNPSRASDGTTEPQLSVERVNDPIAAPAQWKYVTKDADGNKLTEGLLTMPFPPKEGINFVGSWQAKYVGPDGQRDKIGPQLNGGRLAGVLSDGQLRIQLNPNMNDNNVTLTGTVKEDRITGTWEYSTFTGVTNKGTFEAMLNRQ
jgi:hypothetical protein